jgi:hypothetical protein
MSEVPLRRNRDFVLLQSGQLLSSAGSASSAIAYPLLVLAFTHSPAGIVGFATLRCASASSQALPRTVESQARDDRRRRRTGRGHCGPPRGSG